MPGMAKRAAAATRTRRAPAPRAAADDGTRARILDAALAVFAQRGFDGARTREIAERAGANLGLLTYYFQDKERLWRAAVTRAYARLEAELGDVLVSHPGDDERLALERVVRRFVRFVARNPEFMQLMNDEGKRDGARMRWLADRFVTPLYEALRARVEQAQARGLLAGIPPANLHYLVLGAAGLAFSQAAECRRVTGVDPTTDAFADAHADALLRLLAPAAG
jgi:TetR/AcrR family transcriptional regulator